MRRAGGSGRGSCQLDSSCGRVLRGGQRRERGDSWGGAREGLPTARAASAARGPCPALAPLSLGHRAPQRSYARESERSQPALRALHTRRYITQRRDAPAAAVASALPPLGPPSPRAHPAPRPRSPASRPPPAGRPTPGRASPSPTTVAEASPPSSRLSLLAAHAPCRGSPRPAPAGSRGRQRKPHPPRTVRSSLSPLSPLSARRGTVDSAACDQAQRRTAPLAGGTRTSAARPAEVGAAGLRGHGRQGARGGGRR